MATSTAVKSADTLGFKGVYLTNPDHDYAKNVPFRVAIPVQQDDGSQQWIGGGFFKTAKVAARAYNMLAIKHYGQSAVVNDIGKPSAADNVQFQQYLASNPQRMQDYKLSVAKAQDLIKQYGKFATHKSVVKDLPKQPAVAGVI